MSPKVEGLESLVFLSATLPTGPAIAEVSAQSGPTQTPTARPLAAQAARPLAAQAARPLAAQAAARPGINLENLDLSSTIRGNYKLQLAPDGSSGSFQLQGVGSIRGLGPARLSSSYVADQTSAPETLTVTLSTRRGNLSLEVGRAPGDVDPDRSTARLRYQVVEATGALAGASGSGILDMNLRPQMRTLGTSGQLTITLRPDLA